MWVMSELTIPLEWHRDRERDKEREKQSVYELSGTRTLIVLHQLYSSITATWWTADTVIFQRSLCVSDQCLYNVLNKWETFIFQLISSPCKTNACSADHRFTLQYLVSVFAQVKSQQQNLGGKDEKAVIVENFFLYNQKLRCFVPLSAWGGWVVYECKHHWTQCLWAIMSSSMQQEYTVYISWKHSLTGQIGTNRYAISSFACGVVGSVLTGEDSQHLISDILLTFAMCSTKMRDCRLFRCFSTISKDLH